MYADRFIKQLLSYQRLALENWQDSTTFFQTLSFDTGMKILESSEWTPKDSKVYAKKIQAYASQSLKRLNKYLDDTFAIYENTMTHPGGQTPPKQKTGKPRTEGK